MNGSDYDGLMQEIIEDPGNDTPRLVLADWHEENGGEAGRRRAEYIRTGVALPQTEGGPERRGMAAWLQVQLQFYGEPWKAAFTGRGVETLGWERGFVERVRCTAATFASRGGAWADETPLQAVELTSAAGKGAALADCSHFARIKTLVVDDAKFGDDDLAALSRSPHFRSLDTMRLQGGKRGSGCLVGSAGLAQLVAAPAFGRLEAIAVWSSGLDDSCAAAFACADGGKRGRVARSSQASGPGGLKALRLSGGRIGPGGVVALLGSRSLCGALVVDLSGNAVTPEVFDLLADAGLPPSLHRVGLGKNSLADISIDAVAAVLRRHPDLWLGLEDCGIDKRTRVRLANLSDGRIDVGDARGRQRTRVG